MSLPDCDDLLSLNMFASVEEVGKVSLVSFFSSRFVDRSLPIGELVEVNSFSLSPVLSFSITNRFRNNVYPVFGGLQISFSAVIRHFVYTFFKDYTKRQS